MDKLLSREEFKRQVFERDGQKCVFCQAQAIDAHHIIERRLFASDTQKGGYFLSNGASVCEEHHLRCESTEISVEEVRRQCGIVKPVLPEHFYSDVEYDKWGNIILPNGNRLKGELFFDESVQKIIKKSGNLESFTDYVKYQRTYHLPWSPGITDDDRILRSLDRFHGKRVIVTEKMDGENTNWYRDYYHARSLDGRNHPSRNFCKNMWAARCGEIPEGWRVCGENLYAKHSIAYQNLKSYFYGFSVWNERNVCLSWDETIEWFQLLDIVPVPVLYDGIFDEEKIKNIYDMTNYNRMEGYTMRLADSFTYSEFRHSIGKFVRPNHVAPDQHHWFAKEIMPNAIGVE